MPTREAIVDNIIPKQVEKPIPTRVVNTRSSPKPTEIAGQPAINSSPAAASAPVTEESVRLSPQVSALARKEQAYRQREQALKAREQEVAAKLAQAEQFEALKQKLSAKDYSEAEALGLNYEDYVKYVLEKQNGEDPQMAELQKLKAEIEALKKGSEESAANLFEETIAEYKKEISKLVSEHPDFSSVKELKREDAVLQLILDTFEEDGEELTVMEAARLVEEQIVNMGKAFTGLPKFKREIEPEKRTLPRPTIGKTLTNDMTAGSTQRPYKSLQYLSEAERYAEARRRVMERREREKGKI